MTSNISPHRQQVLQQREELRAALKSTVEDDADPLAAYDSLVKWTLQNFANHSDSGLLELLEELLRRFKDDVRYKTGDLRYVKLWILFANHVEKPAEVYSYMFHHGIGKPYSVFFEEYAEALEREGRVTEAETVITLGIRTQARPSKHLQSFYSDFTARKTSGRHLPEKVSTYRQDKCSPTVNAIRTDPLQNIAHRHTSVTRQASLDVPVASQHDVSMTTTQPLLSTKPAPYAHLNTPAAADKRPEKLRFDLTLLLDPDGTEYCFEEARARHLGLLGKKWPPPPPPNATNSTGAESVKAPHVHESVRERSVKVDFNDQGTKTGRHARRQSVTVTINTKQALEDVLDMYNSTMKNGGQVEDSGDDARLQMPHLQSSQNTPASTRSGSHDENASSVGKPRPFQPYVDHRRENGTPGPLKFMPMTTKTPGVNAITPSTGRKALTTKEITTPVPVFKAVRSESNAITPVTSSQSLRLSEGHEHDEVDVFGGEDVTAEDTAESTHSIPPAQPARRPFIPFKDEQDNVPPINNNENAATHTTTKILKFQVHRDENVPPNRSLPFTPKPAQLAETLDNFKEDVSSKPLPERSENVYESGRQPFAKSGRFANFDVMTPITERTFEFTASTRVVDTPGSELSSVYDKGFVAPDAQEKFGTELETEDERDDGVITSRSPLLGSGLLSTDEGVSSTDLSFFDRPQTAPFRVSDGFTIEHKQAGLTSSGVGVGRSIANDVTPVLVANVGVEPSNPCVPSDPDILSKLMSAFPANTEHHELGNVAKNCLERLQRFAEKRSRRSSATSSSGRTSDTLDKLEIELDGDQFEILEKLGEGGFGAVFMARKITQGTEKQDEDEEEYNEDDEDRDKNLVAVKVVRPTNRWESFVLRRIVSAVPDDLRRSIIRPHALYAYKDESYLVLDLCQQGTLLDVVNRAAETGVAQPGGGMDELLAMFFTVELLRIVEGLHARGFIHGDLKIDNCLIRLEDVPGGSSGGWTSEYSPAGSGGWAHKGITLIDFGRTIDTKLFPPGQTFVADWKTDEQRKGDCCCAEMRAGRPWTFQTDYAGLAGIVHCMLFGRYIETAEVATAGGGGARLKLALPMKRYWHVDLWTRLFDTLLNPCAGSNGERSLPPPPPPPAVVAAELLAPLRGELENWIRANCNKGGKNLKGMLKKIEIATLRKGWWTMAAAAATQRK